MAIDDHNICSYDNCARPTWEESLFCLFHEPSPDKDAKAFQDELDIIFTSKLHTLDFSGFHFPKDVFFQGMELPKVIFTGVGVEVAPPFC